ncbi:MAG: Arc family DNA-binding protein [Balneolaceae bacterium]
MTNITVKNIPKQIYDKVREQAKANHRSINSEIIACLEQVVLPQQVSTEEVLYNARRLRNKVTGSLTTEEIEAAIKQGRS